MHHTDHPLYPHYDTLWQSHWPEIQRGQISCDPLLLRKETDPRRGISLIARPSAEVSQRISAMLHKLAELEPDQYYYPQSEMHFTILPLFTGTPEYQHKLDRVPIYQQAVLNACQQCQPIAIESIGITVSPSGVMVQGFPSDNKLDLFRDALREQIRQRGFGHELDQRYRLITAHSTVLRFCAPLRHAANFAQALQEYRTSNFGQSQIAQVDLLLCDWYLSSSSLISYGKYQLS